MDGRESIRFEKIIAGMPEQVKDELRSILKEGALAELEEDVDYKIVLVSPAEPVVIQPHKEPDDKEWFWLVLKGRFAVCPRGGNPRQNTQTTKGPGETFGELVAFGLAQERTARVEMIDAPGGEGRLLKLNARKIAEKALAGESIAVRILLLTLLNECRRVAEMNTLIEVLLPQS